MKIIRFVFLIIHLGVIALLLANFLNIIVTPKVFPYFNFLSLAFPILMIFNVILILFWIILWKKRAFFFLIVSVLFFKPTSRIINYSPKKTESANLKIITFNVHSAKFGRKPIAEFINREDPDIVFLQEAGNVKSDYNFEKLPFVEKAPIVFFYSKYKVVAEKKWIINETGQATAYDVRIRGKMYRFLNVYLQPFYLVKSKFRPTDNQSENEVKFKSLIKRMVPTFKEHQEQISAARDAIESSPYPVIMAGDFNSVPNSYEYYHLGKNLQDAFEIAGNGSSTSFHDWKFPIRIDYIFTSKDILPISYKVDRSKRLSDHFPIIATFKIK